MPGDAIWNGERRKNVGVDRIQGNSCVIAKPKAAENMNSTKVAARGGAGNCERVALPLWCSEIASDAMKPFVIRSSTRMILVEWWRPSFESDRARRRRARAVTAWRKERFSFSDVDVRGPPRAS